MSVADAGRKGFCLAEEFHRRRHKPAGSIVKGDTTLEWSGL